jgi:hypothetical protein
MAGKGLAATSRSVTSCRTHPLAFAYGAQRTRGVSDAKLHARAFVPTRRQTHGVPLAPAMTTEKRVNVAPLLRCGGREIERFRCAAAGLTQGDNAVPAFVGNGLCDLLVVVAALGSHQHRTSVVSANGGLQVERAQVCHHALMVALVLAIMGLAGALALEGDRLEGHQHVTQHQDDVGPRMPDDIALAVVARWGGFWVQAGAVLQGRLNEAHDLPGQSFDALERLGKLPGWRFRALFQRGHGHCGRRLQAFGKAGGMQSGKPSGLF